MQFTSTGASYTGDNPSYTLPERLLDPVGVGNGVDCRTMNDKGKVFDNKWVYSKDDTMAHAHRLVVIS